GNPTPETALVTPNADEAIHNISNALERALYGKKSPEEEDRKDPRTPVRPEVFVMRRTLIEMTESVLKLESEIRELKSEIKELRKETKKHDPKTTLFGIAVIAFFGFVFLKGQIDSIPHELTRQIMPDTYFRSAIGR